MSLEFYLLTKKINYILKYIISIYTKNHNNIDSILVIYLLLKHPKQPRMK